MQAKDSCHLQEAHKELLRHVKIRKIIFFYARAFQIAFFLSRHCFPFHNKSFLSDTTCCFEKEKE